MEKQIMGSFIAALRRASGMTQREMAEKLNVSDKAVSRWERDESAPDLSLLPMIADLFGITIDELVRGRRNTEPQCAEPLEGAKQSRADDRVRRGVQTLAGRELSKLRNLSLLAAGVGIVGVVVALLCNFCFTAAKLGFFLFLVFSVDAAVAEAIVLGNYFTSIGSRMTFLDPAADAAVFNKFLGQYRQEGVRCALIVYALLAGLTGMVLPLAAVPADFGLVLTWEILMQCIWTGAVGVGLVLLLYRFVAHPILVQKGILSAPTEREAARRRIIKRYVLTWAILLVVTGVGALIFNNIGVSTYAEAKVFHDYDSFVEYMEVGQYREQGFDEDYIVEINADADYEIFYDEKGNELCRYRDAYHNSVVKIRYSFDESADGLPLYVYTDRAIGRAYDIQQSVNIILLLLALAEAAVFGILCYRKCKLV